MKQNIVKQIDIALLEKTFRIIDGCLERKLKTGRWKVVKNNPNHSRGYCAVSFNGKNYLYHRIILSLKNNRNIKEGLVIDHLDGNPINNSLLNIIEVEPRENSINKKIHRDGRLCGCYYNKTTRGKKWMTRIRINKKQVLIGYFKSAEDGNRAYLIAKNNINKFTEPKSFRTIIKDLL